MTAQNISMKGLPFTPIDPCWLLESPAFTSDNPRLVRASLKLLNYAWRSVPAGSIPAAFRSIAAICELNEVEIGEHYDDLTQGWELRGERLHHVQMSALCERIAAKYSETLSDLADQASAVMQAPEEFELTPPDMTHRNKGKRFLPDNFAITHDRKLWMSVNGISTDEDQDFVFQKFVTWARGSGQKYIDWDSTFKNFALKENRFLLPSAVNRAHSVPLMSSGTGGRAARFSGGGSFGSRGMVARDHNASVMEQAAASRTRTVEMP